MDSLNRIKDSIEISAVNGGALFISMSDLEQGLRILSLLIAIIYTGCRLFSLWKSNNKNQE
tara:strand:- start:3198 stop:3380 length:183 start_codon:yes stop_codon:yes gene_type:complete